MSDQREIYERDREDPYYEGRHTHRKEGFFERNCDEAWEQVKETFSHPGGSLPRCCSSRCCAVWSPAAAIC